MKQTHEARAHQAKNQQKERRKAHQAELLAAMVSAVGNNPKKCARLIRQAQGWILKDECEDLGAVQLAWSRVEDLMHVCCKPSSAALIAKALQEVGRAQGVGWVCHQLNRLTDTDWNRISEFLTALEAFPEEKAWIESAEGQVELVKFVVLKNYKSRQEMFETLRQLDQRGRLNLQEEGDALKARMIKKPLWELLIKDSYYNMNLPFLSQVRQEFQWLQEKGLNLTLQAANGKSIMAHLIDEHHFHHLQFKVELCLSLGVAFSEADFLHWQRRLERSSALVNRPDLRRDEATLKVFFNGLIQDVKEKEAQELLKNIQSSSASSKAQSKL